MYITYDKYTNKYFLHITDSNVVALSFREVEELKEQLHTICTDVYCEAMQKWADGFSGEGEKCSNVGV